MRRGARSWRRSWSRTCRPQAAIPSRSRTSSLASSARPATARAFSCGRSTTAAWTAFRSTAASPAATASRSTARPTRAVKEERAAAWRSCRRPTPCRKCAWRPAPTTRSSAGPAAAPSRCRFAAGPTSSTAPAYYIHRDAALNANLYENIVRGIPKQEIFHYNPGATIGGPIKRDRTFFFYSYEGLKSGIPVGAGQRTPTELERNGDFSQSGFTIYDPLNTVNGVPQPFAGNMIPRGRMDPVALNMLNYMPAANSQPDAAGNNFFPGENSRFDTYTSGILRIDHNLSASHRLFGRYAHNGRRETRAYAGREPEARTGGYHHRWNNVLSVDLTSTLSQTDRLDAARRVDAASPPRQLDRGRHRRIRFRHARLPGVLRVADPAAVRADHRLRLWRRAAGAGRRTGWRGRRLLRAGTGHQHPRASPAEGWRASTARRGAWSRTPIAVSTWRPSTSRAASRRCVPRSPRPTAADGGNAFASFLLGYAASSNVQLQAPLNWRNSYVAGYLQDDWRLSNRLTVNLGLRWDYEVPTSERDDQVNAGFDYNGVALVCPACPASGLPTRAARRPDVRRRRDLLVGPEQLRPARRLHVPGERRDRRARRLWPDVPAGRHRSRHRRRASAARPRTWRRSTPAARRPTA